MSTRCKVIVKDAHGQVEFYKHHDGYPEGVGFVLTQILLKVKEKEIPAPDTPILHWTLNQYVRALLASKYGDLYAFDTWVHGDLDYMYIVDTDARTVRCYASPLTGLTCDVEDGVYREEYDVVSMYRGLGHMNYHMINQGMYEDYLVTDKK